MSEHKNSPFKISLQGLDPTTAAWARLTQVPMERYNEMANRTPVEGEPRDANLQWTAFGEKEANLLVDTHREKLTPHIPAIQRAYEYALKAGIDQETAEHLTNMFSLGILVGVEATKLADLYAKQGIEDLEAGI